MLAFEGNALSHGVTFGWFDHQHDGQMIQIALVREKLETIDDLL